MAEEKFKRKEKDIKYFFDLEFQNIIDSIYDLFKRINFYSTWGSNVSLGLMGFYLAVLLQYRDTGGIPHKTYSILILLVLSLSLIIGLVVYLNHEANDLKKKIVDAYREMLWKLITVKKDGGFSEQIEEVALPKIKKLNPKMSQLEKQINYKFNNWIIFQFFLVIVSIGMITFDLVTYLFFT